VKSQDRSHVSKARVRLRAASRIPLNWLSLLIASAIAPYRTPLTATGCLSFNPDRARARDFLEFQRRIGEAEIIRNAEMNEHEQLARANVRWFDFSRANRAKLPQIEPFSLMSGTSAPDSAGLLAIGVDGN